MSRRARSRSRHARGIPPVLDGLALTHRRGKVAADLAAAHLAALGCRAVNTTGPAPATATGTTATGSAPGAGWPADRQGVAGRLELYRLDGNWPLPTVRCEIDWAGPVALPVPDEPAVQAACGLMHVHGRRSGAPAGLGIDYASTTAGVLAAQGVLAALLAQQRGLGLHHVTTSVAQAALLAVSPYLAAATTPDGPRDSHLPGGPPFTSADGVRFEIETVRAEAWQHFWALLAADQEAAARCWSPFRQRHATATCPLAHQLHEATAARSFAAVSAAATAAGISIIAVRAGAPCPPDALPWRVTPLPGHALAALPPSPASAGVLPLDGLVVVESCGRVQGPLAGHLLGLLGARVTRVESPAGDPLRETPPLAGDCSAQFLALNRGKQVVELDLGSATGRRAMRELVAGADVFVHSWAPGAADRWDLDAERLCAVRPGLVYAWASGWGATLGPAPPLGTDSMVQAHSGLAALIGPDDRPPTPSLMALTEVLGGAICAQGVLAGLLVRAYTFRSQRVDSSLLAAAMLLQSPLAGSGARRRVPIPRSLPQPLATADGYLTLPRRVAARPDQLAALLGICRQDGRTSAESLTARLRQEPTEVWLARLAGAGLTGTPVCTDLVGLAADSRFAAAVHHDGATFPRAPWEFAAYAPGPGPAPGHR